MEEIVNITIDKIYNEAPEFSSIDDNSLFNGKAGLVLFDYFYCRYKNGGGGDERLAYQIQQLAENSVVSIRPSFCGGSAGINWLFTFLYKKEILGREDWEYLCGEDAGLMEISLAMLENGNYDFLHGAIGIAHYLSYVGGDVHSDFFKGFFYLLKGLFSKSESGNIIPGFSFAEYKPIPDQVNFGLAHGLPSILLFCTQCYKLGICREAAGDIASRIITYILSNINSGSTGNYFPTILEKGGSVKSRLAWCYGDPGVAYSLYRAGMVFKNEEAVSIALDVLVHSTGRQTYAETTVNDACICHGSAGIAHIYNRMWHDSRLPVFKQACDGWIKRTLDFSVHPDGQGGYKTYNGYDDSYKSDFSFLEGAAGIGIVLLSYLTGDFSWDYCIMLNN